MGGAYAKGGMTRDQVDEFLFEQFVEVATKVMNFTSKNFSC